MAFDQTGSAGVMTLDPDEVETSPTLKTFDPSEVEDAPVRQNASTQPGSTYQANTANPMPRASMTPLPVGAVGPLPGIPQPNVDMRIPSLGETLTGVNPRQAPQSAYDYGQSAIPRAVQGAREIGHGQYVKGATDVLGGVNEGLGSQVLPVGSAPAAVAKGLAGSVAGSVAAPYAVKKLGGSPDAQALAGEAGAAFPLAAGVGADLLRRPRPEVLPPVRPGSVEVPEARNLLTAGEPEPATTAGDGTPSQQTAPADITKHPAGKVTGIDVHTGLPIVDRTQASEIPLSAQGADLPQQSGTAGPMSPEAEAISARAAGSTQLAYPTEPEPQPQQGDIQDKLASVGIHGDEANSILDMYGLDSRAANVPESAEDAAAKPWEDQVEDTYTKLANQRGIPVASDDDLFRDQDTTRDARNAVEQVISHVFPEADDRETAPGATEGPAVSSDIQRAVDGSGSEQSITLSPDEVEDAPVTSEADTARPTLAKGAQVTLPDGSVGTVIYMHPGMQIARVRTSDGRSLTVRQSALRLSEPNKQTGGQVRSVPTQDLTLDPQRFQYKLNTSPEGVTDLLKGRRWNDDLGGVISVWHDPADGKTYVVNGHHRATLAKETGTPEVAVRYLKAPDAASARATGALQNIAEGRGTPVDAAKFFRDSGLTPADLEAKGISMGEATAANGLALSRLSPQLFDDAVSGKLRQGRAIAIGKAAPEVEQQEALLKLIGRAEAKGKRVSDDTIEELGRMVRGAQTHSTTQNTLFGAQEQTRNLALEKAEVSSYIRETLGRERKLFSHVSDEGRAQQLGAAGNLIKAKTNAGIAERAGQAQELYDRLSTRVGAVNGILDRAAARVAKGDDVNVVKREAYTATRAALAETLTGPEAGRPQPVQGYSGRGILSPTEAPNGPRAVVAQVKPALPGFEKAVREQSAAQEEERGRQLTNELSTPKGHIEKAAGEMERNSPLFENSEANPQTGLFGKEKVKSHTLYSGGALFDPEAWKTLFPDIAERFSDWVNDKQDQGDKQAAIMRETRGELDRRVSIAAKQLEGVQRDFRLRPRQDALDFFNAAEGVAPMSSIPAKDQALAATFKGYFDKMKADLQSLNPNVLRDFIENYFPHIWERPSHAASVFQQVLSGKRPFAGSGAFLKQRTIPTIQDGIALGLKPVSYNPVDLFLAKYHEMSRFLMAHKTLGMMKDAGTARLVRPATAPPDGWTQLDDRIGTVMSTDADGHLFIRGHYYAPAPAAKVFNAYVSRGLAGRSAIFDTLQAANNRLNALQLGISAFHGTTTAVNAAASDIALGAQQLTQGKPLQGIKNVAEGVTYIPSMISTFRNGSKLMKEYLSPGSYAEFAREANAISLAGGRIRQNTLEIKPLTQALDDLKAGAVSSAMKKTIPAIIDASSRPIMEQWVPRMKLGAFYDMAHNILDTADKESWTQEQIRTRMQTAWDSIDNRFGQMVYDNLFWNKALRDVLMASTRSVGWNAGTIRELGGAAVDTAQQAGKVVSGKAPELTDRMGFAIGMTVSAGLLGSAIYYLLNGERPQTWKDAYFPGKKGEARMSIPGYMKDVVAYAHDPKQTVLNKMSPVLNLLSAALENRDFYGTEIRHPDDPVVQQLWQLAKFAGAEATPFSVRGVQKLVQQKGSLESSLAGQVKAAFKNPKELVAGQFGFQPAPAYIQNSPALNKAHEYDMANMPPGTRTQEQAEKARLRNAISIQFRDGHPDHAAIANLVREGKLTQREVNGAIVTAKTDPLVRAARPLHLDQLLNVYAAADQKERPLLRPIIARRTGDIQKEADPQRRAALRAALQNLLRKGAAQDSGSRRPVSMP